MDCECLRCGHKWMKRNPNKDPVQCPGCHSPVWNKPYKIKPKEGKDVNATSNTQE